MQQFADKVKKGEAQPETYNLRNVLRTEMINLLQPSGRNTQQLQLQPASAASVKPTVLFVVGVNGVGKTTTIAKLCHLYKNPPYNRKILIAAGDVHRAAATTQLANWAKYVGVPIVLPTMNEATGQVTMTADRLVLEALQKAAMQAKNNDPEAPDLIIVDTAGRMQNNYKLMNELSLINQVASKMKRGAPDHTWLILDGTIGQASVDQAKAFQQKVKCNGIIVTKLDGSAKGGVLMAIAHELKTIPVCYVGVGEKLSDLQPFNAEEFVDSILSPTSEEAAAAAAGKSVSDDIEIIDSKPRKE